MIYIYIHILEKCFTYNIYYICMYFLYKYIQFHLSHRRNLSRSLAPYLADPDARVRLAVVEAAGPTCFQRGSGWPALLVIYG